MRRSTAADPAPTSPRTATAGTPTIAETKPTSTAQHAARHTAFELWGRALLRFHDLVWASFGIEVVRPDAGRLGTRGNGTAPLHLLLNESALVWFDVKPVARRLHWMNAHAVRLRVIEAAGERYREHVRATHDGRFQRFERHYGVRHEGTARGWVTPNPEYAERWREHPDGKNASDWARSTIKPERSTPLAVEGTAAHAHDHAGVQRWLRAALARWDRHDAVFDAVYEYAPGIWAHESADISPAARLVPPLWLGAFARVHADQVIVGPRIVTDRAHLPQPARDNETIDWAEMTSRHWDLPSLAGRWTLRGMLKRWFDIAFSLAALAATLPLYPVVMLAIYIEDGRPFFFAHNRQTRGGKNFPCLKFRTMVKDAEKLKAKLAVENESAGPQFWHRKDPRVLRTGRLLRRWQIDELPQFLNVLAGHMSVVGPRPSPDSENQYCPAWREARLSVRPGITGLWQVRRNREPETDFQEWIKYDLEYVRHFSLRRDIEIVLATVNRVIRGG